MHAEMMDATLSFNVHPVPRYPVPSTCEADKTKQVTTIHDPLSTRTDTCTTEEQQHNRVANCNPQHSKKPEPNNASLLNKIELRLPFVYAIALP
jgi:hypothetical protein